MTPRKRILVVDDEAVLRALFQEVLSDAGFDVATAPSGEAALTFVVGGRVDLVVTDFNMGGMNGLELLGRIKAVKPSIPVILLTSHVAPNTALNALQGGAFWYLTKPVDVDLLVEKVQGALDQKERV